MYISHAISEQESLKAMDLLSSSMKSKQSFFHIFFLVRLVGQSVLIIIVMPRRLWTRQMDWKLGEKRFL
jgi:hypothetical protein